MARLARSNADGSEGPGVPPPHRCCSCARARADERPDIRCSTCRTPTTALRQRSGPRRRCGSRSELSDPASHASRHRDAIFLDGHHSGLAGPRGRRFGVRVALTESSISGSATRPNIRSLHRPATLHRRPGPRRLLIAHSSEGRVSAGRDAERDAVGTPRHPCRGRGMPRPRPVCGMGDRRSPGLEVRRGEAATPDRSARPGSATRPDVSSCSRFPDADRAEWTLDVPCTPGGRGDTNAGACRRRNGVIGARTTVAACLCLGHADANRLAGRSRP